MVSVPFDLVFVFERIIASVILLLSSAYVWKLVRYYSGVTLQTSWFFLLGGILTFAVAQLISAYSALTGSDLLRILSGALAITSSLCILGGLLRFAEAWKKFQF